MKNIITIGQLFLLFVAVVLVGAIAEAAPSKSALDIIKRAELNAAGFTDMVNRVSMILKDQDGNSSEREMLIKVLALDDGQSKSLTIFTKPSREKGIALLTHTHATENDEQWLYLPASKRVKKIASNKLGASFRGSEFTYEDISNQDNDQYRFELVSEEDCGSSRCFVVDRFPVFSESSYSRTRLYIDTVQYLLQKGEFFDKEKKLLKTMAATNYQKHSNGLWKPESLMMMNSQTHKSTELKTQDLQFDVGLQEKEFSRLSLRKIR